MRTPMKTNQKRVENIKTLLKREGLKQNALCDIWLMNESNVSRTLISGKVSEELCQRLADRFPQYRITWILGYDDHMTDAEILLDSIQTAKKENDLLHQGFFSFTQLSGFKIDIASINKTETVENILQTMKEYCKISRDGKSVSFSIDDLNSFENEICDYIELRLLHMMK